METRSCPSQHKSRNATLTLDKAVEHELKHGSKLDPNIDIRKLRRTISNRLSAQRSRVRKCQYIQDMEKTVRDLEELISIVSPQVDSYKEKTALLLLQNDSLQKLIECRTNEAELSEIEIERKRAEVSRLRGLEGSANINVDNDYLSCLELTIGRDFGNDHERLGFLSSTSTARINQEEAADADQYINFEQLSVDQDNASE